MDITLTDVLEHTDLVDRLAYPRLAALLTEPTVFDAAPQLAQGLERQLTQMAAVDDMALISLRAPGGRRIDAPAGPLKAIVGAMVDLLTDPARNQPRPPRQGADRRSPHRP